MKIPKKLKIGNLTYSVRYEEDEAFENCGKSSMVKGYIRLNNDMAPELQEETFFHEIVHQILTQKSFSDESKNEQLVDTLSGGLYQVLSDNNLLR